MRMRRAGKSQRLIAARLAVSRRQVAAQLGAIESCE
jgi:DNA-binding CsgD family transcriptional regulator